MRKKITASFLTSILLVSFLSACSAKAENTEPAVSDQQAGTEAAGAPTPEDTSNNTKPEPSAEQLLFTIESYPLYEIEDGRLIASGSYENIRLSEETSARYQELDYALHMVNSDISRRAKQYFDEVEDESRDYLQNDRESNVYGTMNITIEPVRFDKDVLSFFECKEVSVPGASHPTQEYSAYNYNTAAESPIMIADVVSDLAGLASAVKDNLVTLSDGKPFSDVEVEPEKYLNENAGNLPWVIDRDALVLRFAPGSIAPYAAGTLEARIPFSEYPDLFTDKWSAPEGAYAGMIIPYVRNAVDLDGDDMRS